MAGQDTSDDCVDVWYVDLDAENDRASCEGVLSPDELSRANRFHSSVHARQFVTGRAALRLLLGDRAGRDPASLQFRYGPYGKPELEENPLDIRFNVSHAGGRAVIAVCRHFSVGVDIEPLRPVTDRDRVAQLVFSDDELAQLAGAGDKDRAFLSGWTRKEAYIKAIGTGFSEPLRRFSVSLAEHPALMAAGAGGGDVSEWTLVELVDPGHVVALAARTPRARVALRAEFVPEPRTPFRRRRN